MMLPEDMWVLVDVFAANCMCTVWVTRSRSLGWYFALRDALSFFTQLVYGWEGVVHTGVLRMRMGSF
jgi:hypothetical protein